MRLDALVAESRRFLAEAGIADAALDSRLLVCGILGLSTVQLIADGGRLVGDADVQKVKEAMTRRAAGEPVHRILGHRAFHGVTLALSLETLEPRPDTEALVDLALSLTGPDSGPLSILDLGTGTGAILLALLDKMANARGLGIDASEDAIRTARANAAANDLADRADFCVSDWFSAVSGKFDLIVSNPPYIPSREISGLQMEVRLHDPVAALDGGEDGLDPYREIAARAGDHLAQGGILAVEHGFDQAQDVTAIFEERGFRRVGAARDHGGNERALAFDKPAQKG